MTNPSSQFKPVEEMNPMEMVAEIIMLRRIVDKMVLLVQERTVLYTLLHNVGITPLIFSDNSPDNNAQEEDT